MNREEAHLVRRSFPTFTRWARSLRHAARVLLRGLAGAVRLLLGATLTVRGLMALIAVLALGLAVAHEAQERRRAAEVRALRLEMADRHAESAERLAWKADHVREWSWWADVADPELRSSRQAEFEENFALWAEWSARRSRELRESDPFDPAVETRRDEIQRRQAINVYAWMVQETARLRGRTPPPLASDTTPLRGPAIAESDVWSPTARAASSPPSP